ncbi:Hpt domain-containing protein [Novosphingobium sp. PC22D]|uniref:Hpt domain-containing protein n=1 Tax=Novosphingobium sp. PC22D TaxID=1962403 RepID=UPI000BF03020|nr:Hpt domain-containing protein [Novosphingobium sp. PC22D]PEQ13396.1 Hpt domain-containing protein [Novosphingobium sp. PC22D]
MAQDAGALDVTLAAAAGEDRQLYEELREAFRESVARQVDLLSRSRCDGNWTVSAMRLKGLAASFHVDPLHELAERALEAAPGEPTVVRALAQWLAEFSEV